MSEQLQEAINSTQVAARPIATKRRSLHYQLRVLRNVAEVGNIGTLNGSLYAYCCTHQLPYPPKVDSYKQAFNWLVEHDPRARHYVH